MYIAIYGYTDRDIYISVYISSGPDELIVDQVDALLELQVKTGFFEIPPACVKNSWKTVV